MSSVLGMLTLALAAAGLAGESRPDTEIIYEIRYAATQGLAWREAGLADLKLISRQGDASVWICPPAALTRILTCMRQNTATNVLQAPRITGASGKTVHAQNRSNLSFATRVSWNEGAPRLESEKVRVGWMTTMVGRKLDQGILLSGVFDLTDVLAVHHVAYSAPAGNARASCQRSCQDIQQACYKPENMRLDVPEVAARQVAGEWLIGPEECLIISFGVHTQADREGRAVATEKLMIVSAHELTATGQALRAAKSAALLNQPRTHAIPLGEVADDLNRGERRWNPVEASDRPGGSKAPAPIALAASSAPSIIPPPAPIAIAPSLLEGAFHLNPSGRPNELSAKMEDPASETVRSPRIPSRTIPQGVHKDGKLAALPPLPKEAIEDDEPSSEPRPSPQTPRPADPSAKPTPTSDPQTVRTSDTSSAHLFFELGPTAFSSSSNVLLRFTVPIQKFTIPLPLNKKLELEVLGQVVDSNDPVDH